MTLCLLGADHTSHHSIWGWKLFILQIHLPFFAAFHWIHVWPRTQQSLKGMQIFGGIFCILSPFWNSSLKFLSASDSPESNVTFHPLRLLDSGLSFLILTIKKLPQGSSSWCGDKTPLICFLSLRDHVYVLPISSVLK